VPAAAVTYYLGTAGWPSNALLSDLPSAESGPSASTERPSSAALAAFRRALTVEEPTTLEARLAELFSEPYSVARETEIRALFMRLAALDLGRALRVAETPGFDRDLIADVVRALAEDDADTALAALASVRNAASRLDLAVALLDAIGFDPQGIDRVAAALPNYQRIDFQARALAELAETDPNRALGTALGLDEGGARNAAAQRVGVTWAHLDPVGALSRAATLPPELEAAYRASVAREWARLDAAGFLSYADSQPALDDFLPALMQTMGVDPGLTFEVASRHPPVPIGNGFSDNITVERTAFGTMTNEDPERMLGMLDAMPEGYRKEELSKAFAEIYTLMRPGEAMAWARSLEPRNATLEATVILNASRRDYEQALRWFSEYELPPPGSGQLATPDFIVFSIGTYLGTDPNRFDIANDLRSRLDEPNVAATLARLTTVWALTDPVGTFDWAVSGDAAVDPALAGTLARMISDRDAAEAAALTDRLPPELRGNWLQEVAARYASQDPDAASDWVVQFQGEPGYEAMLGRVLQQAAMVNPESAARTLQFAPAELQQSAAARIAAAWAGRNLAQAGQWAASLGNASARSAAVGQVANTWAYRDPRAAQRWAAGLPRGDVRDQALASVLTRLARDDFASTIDPDQARSLLERIDDPALRQQAAEAIERVLSVREP
jgi:uncharacterized protein (DUF2267 family)